MIVAFKYHIRCVLSDPQQVDAELLGAHLLYNDLIAIERARRAAVTAWWAEQGGFSELLALYRDASAEARELEGDARKAAFRRVDELARQVEEAERAAVRAHYELAQAADPVLARRKERAAQLRAEAKERGEKITPKAIADVLDADPACITEKDRIRLEAIAEAAQRGKKPSGKKIAQLHVQAGCVAPTEHLEAKARADGYAAYQARGVTQGTRGFIIDAIARAIKDAAPRVPRFRQRDQGRMSFGVSQVVDGNLSRICDGTHTQVQVATLPDTGRIQPGSRRSGKRALVRVRIGSEGTRKTPVWAEFETSMHRPLPPDCVVRQARVSRERVGSGYAWHVVLTLQLPDDSPVCRLPIRADKAGTVAIDLGFRSRDGDLRVAYFAASDGTHAEITTPAKRCHEKPDGKRTGRYVMRPISEVAAHADGLHELLSRSLTEQTSALGEWTRAQKVMPEWFAERTGSIGRWRSEYRLVDLYHAWTRQRFEGDEGAYESLDAWHKRWRHLRDWAEHERRGMVRARREHYRQVARDLVDRYSLIVISDVDLASTKRRKRAEETEGLVLVEDRVRHQAQLGAPGELREAIIAAAKKAQTPLITAKSDSTTCHACGAACDYDRRKLTHECEHCGTTWDQDHNAALNMLREQSGDPKRPAGARKPKKPAPSPTSGVASQDVAE